MPDQSRAELPHSLEWHKQALASLTEYAGFWRRYVASLIDGIFVTIVARIAIELTGFELNLHYERGTGNTTYFLDANSTFLLALAIGWLYYAGLESSSRQATLGKRILSVVVTDLEGGRIAFVRASMRYLNKLFSSITLMVGFLIQPFTTKRQALHDLLARTMVVNS